jgi:aminocarboxymuconate-semialdehyde decarboxylase
MLKIDTHTHIIPEKLPKWTEKFGYDGFIHLEHHRQGFAKMMQGERFFREIASNCWDPALRIEEYASLGTKVQVICTIPVLFSYWAQPKDGWDIARFLNDHIADIVQKYPKHYVGLGTVPLQDIEFSIQELHRIKALGFKGIQIGSNINDINLDDERFWPFFEACEQLDMSVMIHPWNMMGKAKMEKYWLPWLVGMPAETTRALCSLLFSGAFDKWPNLRFLFSHAGGNFFFTMGRIEHGFHCRPDLVAIDNPINPRKYYNRFWIDCITHDSDALAFIMKYQDSDKICLGSDYPFPLGDLTMGKFLEEMNLPKEDLTNIMSEAAMAWLNLDVDLYSV